MEQMTITSAIYHKDAISDNVCAVLADIDGKRISVPLDPANRHYAEIMRQVEAGTLIIAEAD